MNPERPKGLPHTCGSCGHWLADPHPPANGMDGNCGAGYTNRPHSFVGDRKGRPWPRARFGDSCDEHEAA